MTINTNSKKVENLLRSHIFLIDGIGALASALTIGPVLPYFDDGLPTTILRIFSLIAILFSVYSLCCHIFKRSTNWLMPIIGANTLFCISTLAVTVYFFEVVSLSLILYFIAETLIIGTLVAIEVKVLRSYPLPLR